MKPQKPYFFYGHRKPSQNRPTVRGGLFANRQVLNPKVQAPASQSTPFTLEKWDPDRSQPPSLPSTSSSPSELFFSSTHRLSPIARFILDAFRKHVQWGPPVVAELSKLRRVTPDLVAEVLKSSSLPHVKPSLATKFFHWAGKQKGYKHNFASYNALAYFLNKNNLFRAADQLPELMDSQGRSPSEKQFEILIRMHSDNNRGLRIFYVYEKMKKFGVKPRVFLYNRILDGLIKTGHLDLALKVYDDFRQDGLLEESVTFMILIRGLSKAGRVDEALALLSRMREKVCRPDIFAYTAIIKVLVSQGNLDGCLRLWEEMEGDGVKPDVMAYATMVAGLCKGGRVQKGYEFFREMKVKGYLIDREIYAVLIEAFVRNGKVGIAFDLLSDLVDSGYRADLGIYNSLIEGLCNVKQVDKAYKLLQVTIQDDLQPDFVTVKPVLLSFAELKRMDDFCMLLEQRQNLGFIVIDELSKFFLSMTMGEEKILMALEVFESLKEKGYSSVPIYNILMESLLRIGEMKKALSLFDEIKESNFEPDSKTYSIAIQSFVDVGNIEEACNCYNKITDASCVPSLAAYSSLAKGLCKIGEIDASVMLVHDCLASVENGPMEFKFALRISHICKSNDSEKVIEVIDEMVQLGCPPRDVTCAAVISGMSKHGTIEEARKVFSYLRECKLLTEANMIVYEEVLIEHMKRKTAELVISGIKFFGLESKLRARGCKLLESQRC